jgi:hypothetical protein
MFFGFCALSNTHRKPLSFDFTHSTFVASRTAAPVVVNFIDFETQSPLASPTIIKGIVGEKIEIGVKGGSFKAPSIPGFKKIGSSINPLIISTVASKNIINLYYKAELPKQENNL